MDLRAIAFILFILMYVIMIAKPNWKIYAIWGVAIVFMLVGILRPNPLYILSVINWNVLMMIGGTMLVVWFFIESKMPNLLADIILYPDGRMHVVDLDELAEALDEGLITQSQMSACLRQLNHLITIIYRDKFDRLQSPFEKNGL